MGAVVNHQNGTWSWSGSFDDGPAESQTITITADDGNGETSQTSFSVVINNIAPAAELSVDVAEIFVHESVLFTFGSESDPSQADTSAGFQYSYDCEGDGTWEMDNQPVSAFSCSYPIAGVFAAVAKIADKDGGETMYFADIVVLTPQQALESLIADINGLKAKGVLNKGQASALTSLLENAIAILDQGQLVAAVNEMESFIYQVEAFNNGGILQPVVAQSLIEKAQRIIIAAQLDA